MKYLSALAFLCLAVSTMFASSVGSSGHNQVDVEQKMIVYDWRNFYSPFSSGSQLKTIAFSNFFSAYSSPKSNVIRATTNVYSSARNTRTQAAYQSKFPYFESFKNDVAPGMTYGG